MYSSNRKHFRSNLSVFLYINELAYNIGYLSHDTFCGTDGILLIPYLQLLVGPTCLSLRFSCPSRSHLADESHHVHPDHERHHMRPTERPPKHSEEEPDDRSSSTGRSLLLHSHG